MKKSQIAGGVTGAIFPAMNTELQKIEFFYKEAAKLWNSSEERARSRQFYELWEDISQPKPFEVKGGQISMLGRKHKLSAGEGVRTAYFAWDCREGCPALHVESETDTEKFLLGFDGGGRPLVTSCGAVPLGRSGSGLGERLEIVYDVIEAFREKFGGRDILSMTKKEFAGLLGSVAEGHPDEALRVVRKASAKELKELLRRAAEDMASDETSDQLSLPLDGKYAVGSSDTAVPAPSADAAETTTDSVTPWTIRTELGLLCLAARKALEAERAFILDFKKMSVLKADAAEAVLEIPARPEWPLLEGQILNVFERGCNGVFGSFKIDIYDGTRIYGRLRADIPAFKKNHGRCYANAVRSPRALIAAVLEKLRDENEKGALGQIASSVNHALGLSVSANYPGNTDRAPAGLDASQKRAWADAVDPRNRIVLVQGPPGTGKTAVLESVLRELCGNGRRILLTAPSNTAVDNICRRLDGLPILRFGLVEAAIAPDIAAKYWVRQDRNIHAFSELRRNFGGGGVYAGTHVGIIKDSIIDMELSANGLFDTVLFDEAGMSRIEEFLLCARLAGRAVLFGDHMQLPPFPLPSEVLGEVGSSFGPLSRRLRAMLAQSALEWLAEDRKFPVILLRKSYRCQNPHLLRFSSSMFYDAAVRTSEEAEYFKLSYHERRLAFPKETVRLYRTSSLPLKTREERLFLEGEKPGLDNPLEAAICRSLVLECIRKYPPHEITVIAPYRRQVKLVRSMLLFEDAVKARPDLSERVWEFFLRTRIATVDSFQGGESDVVIISYVRSNGGSGIGFVADHNRINVAHTRARREMFVVADIDCLKKQASNNVFERMERAIRRDGQVIDVDKKAAAKFIEACPAEKR